MTTKANLDDLKDDMIDNNGSDISLETREIAITKSKSQKMAEVLEAHRGERHIIVMHDFPDPDAISQLMLIGSSAPNSISKLILSITARSAISKILPWCDCWASI